MMGAEWIWLERWKGVSPREFMDEGEFPDVVALSRPLEGGRSPPRLLARGT